MSGIIPSCLLAPCPAPSFATTKLNHERSVTHGDRKKPFLAKTPKNGILLFQSPTATIGRGDYVM